MAFVDVKRVLNETSGWNSPKGTRPTDMSDLQELREAMEYVATHSYSEDREKYRAALEVMRKHADKLDSTKQAPEKLP